MPKSRCLSGRSVRVLRQTTLFTAMVAACLAPRSVQAVSVRTTTFDSPQPTNPIERMHGQVIDSSGAPTPGATVTITAPDRPPTEFTTGIDGTFVADMPPIDTTIVAAAPGFAPTRLVLDAVPRDHPIRLVLHPAPLTATVTVTGAHGSERRLETPSATSVITSAELLNTAAERLDDALRHTPGFTLFRRSSSREANPSTQGVTLRGLAGSAASRAVVLVDGLPLNDPFGSWVYWNRVPQAAIERVEVVRGSGGDVYADAMGGVIQVLTFSPRRPRVRGSLDVASQATTRASLFAAGQLDRWQLSAAGEWLATDGAIRVARDERGPIDVPAQSDYRNAFVTMGYQADGWWTRGKASAFSEDRNNGTPVQINTTDWREYSAETSGTSTAGVWTARGAGGTQTFYQTFSAIAADRASERLVRVQRTPASFGRVSGQWTQSVGSHVLLLGAEGRRTDATVHDTGYSFATGLPGATVESGGIETSASVFARASLTPTDRVSVVVGGRAEFWRVDPIASAALPGHVANFFSPRASLAWQARERVSLRASAYRAYRAPTLNELYKGFRVGDVVTASNPLLDPERLTGFEGGLEWTGTRSSARITGFWNHADGLITNVTLSVTPSLISREKQNAGRVRAAGLELEADVRPHRLVTLTALAAFTSSHFLDAESLPELDGNRVPQVPRYQLGAGLTYADPDVATVTTQLRIVGEQFDDDQNELTLRRFAVLDALASRMLSQRATAFVSVENLFDAEYDVGRTPVRTVGWPRTVRAGVRIFLP